MSQPKADFRAVTALLIRRARLIFIFYFAALAFVFMTTNLITPIYSANAKLLVDVDGQRLFDPQAEPLAFGLVNGVIDSEVELLKSDPVYYEVARALPLEQLQEFETNSSILKWMLGVLKPVPPQKISMDEIVRHLKDAVFVKRKGRTFIIELSARSIDPQTAAAIVNQLAQLHIDLRLAQRINSVLRAQTMLEQQVEQAKNVLMNSELQLSEFVVENLAEIAAHSGDPKLAELKSVLFGMKEQEALARTSISRIDSFDISSEWNVLAAEIGGATLEQLARQRDELAAQAAKGVGQDGVENIEKDLEFLKANFSLLVENERSSTSRLIGELVGQQQVVVAQVRLRLAQVNLPAAILSKFYQVKTQTDAARKQYEELVKRTSNMDRQLAAQTPSLRIAAFATPASKAVFPNRTMIMLTAAVLLLGLCVAVTYFYDLYLGGVTTDDQLSELMGKRIGASFPQLALPYISPNQNQNSASLIHAMQQLEFSEASRRLRLDLELALSQKARTAQFGEKSAKIVLVTSSVENEGKSFVSAALSKVTASLGKRVLLIDGDLRKPTLHHLLGVESDQGFSSFLATPLDATALTASFHNQIEANLDVLIGQGNPTASPDRLLAGPGLEKLLNSVSKHYDYIIIDTPPLLPVVDTNYFLKHADAAIFVVKSGKLAQAEVRKAHHILAQFEHLSIVPVLNGGAHQTTSYLKNYKTSYAG
ncbi:polysaccharide biosynthesis tyrosine autokinase [Maritalea sp.]|uniref:polysaccharide biosynthesis tyrosine autokinase n=1 Tax=Maritalea sp. TaxID=2003361 RepID=UPI003EF2F346